MAKAVVGTAENDSATTESATVTRNHAQEWREAEGNVVLQNEIMDDFIKVALKAGEDYGIIPNTKKPSLYKGGAEKLLALIGATPRFNLVAVERNWDKEVEYMGWVNREKKMVKGKGFIFYEFDVRLVDENDREIGYGVGNCNSLESKYASQGVAATANTIEKMAKKRALVDALLTASRISGRFTQDVEDMDLGGSGGGRKNDDFEL